VSKTQNTVEFRALFEQTPALLLVVRSDAPRFTVVAASDAWLRAAATTRDDVLGRSVSELLPREEGAPATEGAAALLASFARVVRERAPDLTTAGSARWRAINAPVLGPDGRVAFVVHRREDVTAADSAAAPGPPPDRAPESEGLADRLRALALELTRSEQLERRRLAAVLDTGLQPLLFAAKMHLSLLGGEPLSGPAEGAADHARELLDEAVGVARTLTVALSPPVLPEAGLVTALEWLVERVRQQHRVTVSAHLDPAAAPPGWPLAEMLFEGARELVFNAVKYSGTDRVALVLDREADQVRLKASDEGVGFDPAAIRPGTATAGQFGLFGLRQRLTWLGGSMEVDSAPGRGTRVTLRVPLGAQPEQAEPELRPPRAQREPAADAIRVVVADDHRIVREGLVQLLALEDDIAVVGEAENGEPDIVTMDITMPEMDGIAAVKEIKQMDSAAKVVMVSAMGQQAMVIEARLHCQALPGRPRHRGCEKSRGMTADRGICSRKAIFCTFSAFSSCSARSCSSHG